MLKKPEKIYDTVIYFKITNLKKESHMDELYKLTVRVSPGPLRAAKIKSVELGCTYSAFICDAINALTTLPDIKDLAALQNKCQQAVTYKPFSPGRPLKTDAKGIIKKKITFYIYKSTRKNLFRFNRRTHLSLSDIVDLSIKLKVS